jgi:hypothetical protein
VLLSAAFSLVSIFWKKKQEEVYEITLKTLYSPLYFLKRFWHHLSVCPLNFLVFFAVCIVSKETRRLEPSPRWRRGAISEHIKVSERTKIWPWVTTGPETRKDCADESQQQFTRPTDSTSQKVLLIICTNRQILLELSNQRRYERGMYPASKSQSITSHTSAVSDDNNNKIN